MRERIRRLFPGWIPGTRDITRRATQAAEEYRPEMGHAAYRRVNRRVRQVRHA